jgi:hypothetical protein
MNATLRNRILVAGLVSAVAASGLVGAAVRYSATRGAQPAAVPTVPAAAVVGTATGEIDRGMPVYRLPTVEVTVSRSEALARIAREDALAAAKSK